jgi:hypothetical protein
VRCDGGIVIHIENLVIFGDFLFYFEQKVFFTNIQGGTKVSNIGCNFLN